MWRWRQRWRDRDISPGMAKGPEVARGRKEPLLEPPGGSMTLSHLDLRGPAPPGSQQPFPTWILVVTPYQDPSGPACLDLRLWSLDPVMDRMNSSAVQCVDTCLSCSRKFKHCQRINRINSHCSWTFILYLMLISVCHMPGVIATHIHCPHVSDIEAGPMRVTD